MDTSKLFKKMCRKAKIRKGTIDHLHELLMKNLYEDTRIFYFREYGKYGVWIGAMQYSLRCDTLEMALLVAYMGYVHGAVWNKGQWEKPNKGV